jgi:hypothetical protein
MAQTFPSRTVIAVTRGITPGWPSLLAEPVV